MTTPNLTDPERDARDFLARVEVAFKAASREGPGIGLKLVAFVDAGAELNTVDGADALTVLDGVTGMDFHRLLRSATAILASRDTAWLSAIEGMRKSEQFGGYPVGANPWNAALSALADRMGVKNG